MAASKTKLNDFQSRKEMQNWSDRDSTWNLWECKCDATTPAPLRQPLSGRANRVPLYIHIQMTFLR